MKNIAHIALAVKDLEESSRFYSEILGLRPAGSETVPGQKVKVAFFTPGEGAAGAPAVELLSPTSPDSPIAGFLEKRGPGLHHIAFEVADIEAEIARLSGLGVSFIDAKPREGSHGSRIAFIHPKSTGGVLIELCENRTR